MQAAGNHSLEQLCVNTIRTLSIDAVQKANSGHPGLPLDAAPMAYVLWTHFLKHNPENPKWFDRDRFVLSAGHGSALLYSVLHLTGYAVSLDDLKQFRQWGSITPGHPEYGVTPGVEITTGPLGQGFANGVGMAMAEAYLAARYNRPGFKIIDHFTYGIAGDGDLMEGVTAEAASLAGHLKLGKLIYLYDDNRITLSASTELSFTEDRAMRFAAYGWHTQIVEDGNNLLSITNAIAQAKKETDRPSLILIRTHIGFGSPHKQDTFEAHGSPLGKEEVELTKQNLGWPAESSFYVPEPVKKYFERAVTQGKSEEEAWNSLFEAYAQEHPDIAEELKQIMKGELAEGWNANIPEFPADPAGISTRVAGGKVMQAINPSLPGLMGGSADLNTSTFTYLINYGNFQNSKTAVGDLQGAQEGGWNYTGREHAMGAISNGLATFGSIIPFTATFLVFSDYMRPAIRLAALMNLQVIFVFTHDSIAVGEDGPTHEPVEQLAALRAIPGLIVIRPADANETAVAWQVAIETRHHPVTLILSRQAVPTLDRKVFASAEGLRKGAYILSEAPGSTPDIILIATGSEVSLIVAAKEMLEKENISVRLVSMPSWELFEAQTQEYRDAVLPPSVSARLAVEAGVSQGWERYIKDKGEMVSVERFGASAPAGVLMKEYGLTSQHVYQKAVALLYNNSGDKK